MYTGPVLTISSNSERSYREDGHRFVPTNSPKLPTCDVCVEKELYACAEVIKMGFLSNAPQGFSGAVSALNSLPQGVLAEMVS